MDFAKTLDTSLANQLRVAKNEVEAMAGEIGQKLLPYILDAIKWIRENKDTIIMWGSAIIGATLAIKGMLIINTIVGAIKVWTIATEGMTIAQKLLNIAMMANPIGIVIAAIGALVGVLIYLWTTNEGFRNSVIELWNNIKETTVNVFNAVKETILGWGEAIGNFFTETIPQWIENIKNWFSELPYNIGYALGATIATIIKWGMDSWNYFVTNVPLWIQGIANFFSQLPSKIWTWLLATINNVITFGYNLSTKAKEAGLNMVTNIMNAVKELPGKMLDIGKNIVKGVWEGITGMGGWIMDKVGGFFGGIIDGAKKVLGIHSPSRVFRDQVGAMMAQGVGVGFTEEMPDINNEIQKSINTDVKLDDNNNGIGGTVINQTINSKAVLSPLEMAQETLNTMNRAKWRLA